MILETLQYWGFSPRDGVYILIFIFGLGGFYQRLKSMENKMDSFVVKEVLAEKEKTLGAQHDAHREDVQELRERVAVLEGRAMVR